MARIQIVELRNHLEYLDTVIEWLYSEWGSENHAFWEYWVRSSLSENDIPKTYIAFVDDVIAGTYSLWRCDLQSCQDLYPWFGGLFVSELFRGKVFNGKKLGEWMQLDAVNELTKMNYHKVYLFTELSEKYYLENGWRYLRDAPDENNKMVKVLSLSF